MVAATPTASVSETAEMAESTPAGLEPASPSTVAANGGAVSHLPFHDTRDFDDVIEVAGVVEGRMAHRPAFAATVDGLAGSSPAGVLSAISAVSLTDAAGAAATIRVLPRERAPVV